MSKIKITAMAVAASMTLGLMGSIAAPATAEAGSFLQIGSGHRHNNIYFGFRRNNHRHFHQRRYNSCNFLKRRARHTHSRYWWNEYRRCINGLYY